MLRGLGVGCLVMMMGCSSSSPTPIDPLTIEYCAACSELASCERVINETLTGACPDETRAWYTCATDNACDDTPCDAEFAARTACLGRAPADLVRVGIFLRRPSANLGHRGTGPTRPGHPFPENSISSFVAAMDEGADGVSLDVEITQDGGLIVMHDDTLEITTDCTGCVSERTFDEIRACRLLDGDRNPTNERPPTLVEVYSALDDTALVDVELKVFGTDCLTDTTGPEQLVRLALDQVTQIGAENRTIFSSFDETAAGLVKMERPDFYSALLLPVTATGSEGVETALRLNQDAIHPFVTVTMDTVQQALDAGLDVNIWTANTTQSMQEQLDKGSTAIITDVPATLADLLDP